MRSGKILIKIICVAVLANVHFAAYSKQRYSDSLIIKVQEKSLPDSVKIKHLVQLTRILPSPDDKLIYAQQLLKLANKLKEPTYVIRAYLTMGTANRLKGELKKSLESLFLSAKVALENNEYNLLVEAYSEISITYSTNKDSDNALNYSKKAIEILRGHGNKKQLAINILNTGYSYYKLNELDTALIYYKEAGLLFGEIDLVIGKAYTIGNRGLVYWKLGNYSRAESDILKAIEMLEPLGDQFGMSDYHNQLGEIYLEQDKVEKTIYHIQKAMAMAMELGLKEQIRDGVSLLSKLYAIEGDYKKALEYQTKYIRYKDSIENNERTKRMADIRTNFEVSIREKEIDLLEKQHRLQQTYIVIAVILLVLAVIVLLYFRQRLKTTKLISVNDRKMHNEKIKDLMNSHETKTLQSMLKGRDVERKRLAKDLHNHFGSLLATIKVNLNGMDNICTTKYKTITTLVDQACNDIRNLSHNLNMGISNGFGLVSALEELADHIRHSGELEVEFSASMEQGQMDSESEIVVYRIVQELVSNVLKHAEATKLSILLTYFDEENLLNILVNDNGKGFDVEAVRKEQEGIGLNTLTEMAAWLKGDIQYDSNPNSGTTVNLDLLVNN